jgi:hypothetical protein
MARELKFLINVKDQMTAQLIEDILAEINIPIIRKSEAVLDLVLGSSNADINIYVDEENYRQASEAVEEYWTTDKEEE